MMHEPEKSDPSTVASKPANKSEGSDAESVERREGAEGNTNKDRMRRTQSRVSMSSGLERVRERAKAEKKERFTALLHHVDVDLLRAAFSWLKRDAAPGVDGMTWRQYEQNLEGNLVDLHARVHRGAYRALALTAQVHSESGWTRAAAGDRCAGGQNRPACGGGSVQRDLRGRFSRVLVWVQAQARPARCAGRTCRRDYPNAGELDCRHRRPILFRYGESRVAHPVRRTSDRRSTHDPPDSSEDFQVLPKAARVWSDAQEKIGDTHLRGC